ncbi:hypothetical protein JYU09_01785 [bacterium AH-315-O15]|nr:hypothetical protein [bacterium AH-315-O15]
MNPHARSTTGIDLLRDSRQRFRVSFQVDVENLMDNIYRVAQEDEFSPAQFSVPRLIAATVEVHF